VNHGVTFTYSVAERFTVTNVSMSKFKIRVRPDAEKRFAAIRKPVKDPHLVTSCEQKRSQGGPNVACSAGNKNPHL
jgi:hypothetical protein